MNIKPGSLHIFLELAWQRMAGRNTAVKRDELHETYVFYRDGKKLFWISDSSPEFQYGNAVAICDLIELTKQAAELGLTL